MLLLAGYPHWTTPKDISIILWVLFPGVLQCTLVSPYTDGEMPIKVLHVGFHFLQMSCRVLLVNSLSTCNFRILLIQMLLSTCNRERWDSEGLPTYLMTRTAWPCLLELLWVRSHFIIKPWNHLFNGVLLTDVSYKYCAAINSKIAEQKEKVQSWGQEQQFRQPAYVTFIRNVWPELFLLLVST